MQECLDYALENNIQLRQNRNDYLSGVEDTKEARAALLPSLTASTTQAYTNYPSSNVSDNDSYTGTYGVNADLVLYQGGMLRTTVRRQQLQNRIDALTVEEAENDIRLALVEAYMQALYASEAVEIAVKYQGYIDRQLRQVAEQRKMENRPLPPDLDYLSLRGLRTEARQKLDKIRPPQSGAGPPASRASPRRTSPRS